MTDRDEAGGRSDPPHEIRLATTRVFDGKLVRVRVDRVRLPSGRENVREVVEHPGAVVILPLTADGDVLLVRQYRYAVGRTLLELPAGILEPNESAFEAARRELSEETGHEPDRLTELCSFFSSPGFSTERLTLVRADDCRPAADGAIPDEPLTIERVRRADVASLLSSGVVQIEDAKTLIGLLWLTTAEQGPRG